MATTGAPSSNISEQFVREAPDIEAYKLGLMQSAKALAAPTLPAYQVAGMTDQQLAALQAGQAGIGAFAPYLQSGSRALATGTNTLGEAADVLRGADTRNQFQAAQEAYNLAAQPAAAIGNLSNVAGAGMGYLGSAGQDIDVAQQMARQSAYQPGFQQGASQFLRGAEQGQQAVGQAQSLAGQGIGSLYRAADMAQSAARGLGNAPMVFAPGIAGAQMQAAQMGPAERVSAQRVAAPVMGAAQMGPAQQISTQSFAQPGFAEAYMSPYMQNVVNAQQREAIRQSNIQRTSDQAAATRAAAFGGSRQAIVEAERQRNLATQLGDIQAAGLQSAYQQAQGQFNTEQQARLAAQQANQQAGLTVGGQNLSAQQQTNLANQAAMLQAQGMNAQQAMQAALANQQAGLTVGGQNLSAQQQANVQNQAAALQAQGLNAQQAMQAALANQQMQGQYDTQRAQLGMQAAQQLQQAGIGTLGAGQQLGQLGLQGAGVTQAAGQGLMAGAGQQGQLSQGAAGLYGQLAGQQAGLAGQYAGIAGQQANILGQQSQLQQQLGQGIGNLAAQQFGVGQNLAQGLGSLGSQIGNLGVQQAALGQTAQQLGQNDVNFLYNIGSQQQKQAQAELDALRATKMQQAMQPYQQLAFQSDIYKGAPSTQMAVTQQQQAAPSPFQQIAGLGTGLAATAAVANKAGIF